MLKILILLLSFRLGGAVPAGIIEFANELLAAQGPVDKIALDRGLRALPPQTPDEIVSAIELVAKNRKAWSRLDARSPLVNYFGREIAARGAEFQMPEIKERVSQVATVFLKNFPVESARYDWWLRFKAEGSFWQAKDLPFVQWALRRHGPETFGDLEDFKSVLSPVDQEAFDRTLELARWARMRATRPNSRREQMRAIHEIAYAYDFYRDKPSGRESALLANQPNSPLGEILHVIAREFNDNKLLVLRAQLLEVNRKYLAHDPRAMELVAYWEANAPTPESGFAEVLRLLKLPDFDGDCGPQLETMPPSLH